MNYKKTYALSITTFLALTFLSPSFSLAMNEDIKATLEAKREEMQEKRDAKKEEIKEKITEKTCGMISKQADQIQNRLTERASKLLQKRTEIESKIKERVETRTTARTERREKWEDNKEGNWTKLEEKAGTDEQKAAVAKFIEAVQTAVKIKNDAIDELIKEVRATVQTENNARKSELDSKLEDYKNTIASITAQVKTDCSAGKDAREIREYYKTELKKAHSEFQAERKDHEDFKGKMIALREEKKSEIKTIIETFKASIETAKTELRATFLETTE